MGSSSWARIKSWNRGQLIVFLGAALLGEGTLYWKYQDIDRENASNRSAVELAYPTVAANRAKGIADDSLAAALDALIQEMIVEGPKGGERQRVLESIGRYVIPVIVLVVAFTWVTGKPRKG